MQDLANQRKKKKVQGFASSLTRGQKGLSLHRYEGKFDGLKFRRPCLDCGALSYENRCPQHEAINKAKRNERYNSLYRKKRKPSTAEITKRDGGRHWLAPQSVTYAKIPYYPPKQ